MSRAESTLVVARHQMSRRRSLHVELPIVTGIQELWNAAAAFRQEKDRIKVQAIVAAVCAQAISSPSLRFSAVALKSSKQLKHLGWNLEAKIIVKPPR